MVHFCVKPSSSTTSSKAPEITTVQPWSLGYFLQSTLNRFRHTIFLLPGDYYGRENFEPVKTYHQFIYRYTSSVKLHVIPAGDTGGFERGFNHCHGLEFLNELLKHHTREHDEEPSGNGHERNRDAGVRYNDWWGRCLCWQGASREVDNSAASDKAAGSLTACQQTISFPWRVFLRTVCADLCRRSLYFRQRPPIGIPCRPGKSSHRRCNARTLCPLDRAWCEMSYDNEHRGSRLPRREFLNRQRERYGASTPH